jgi:RTX calcium-binding nonapeptide repeat (4 copies)
MKKAILITLTILAAATAATAHAESGSYTVVLAGGSAQNMIHIWLTPDGTNYVIDSVVPLEVGGTICENAQENPNELLCKAPLVAGFEVNAGIGDDKVKVSGAITIPVTLRGGPGNDVLIGGAGADKLIGGPGNDRLIGGAGNDLIFGGPGDDLIRGGPGDDVLRGGPGNDSFAPGSGQNAVRQDAGGREEE